jgi:UDP-GlcNAc:undecaprenyl-phosphate GlcNAc-1-phosphate transferase
MSAQMLPFLYLGGLSLILAFALTPVAMWAAKRWDVMDHPDTFLKPHARAVPYLGGLALALAWLLTMCTALATIEVAWPLAVPVLLGGLAITVLGAADDIRHIDPKLRLGLSALIVAGVLLKTGNGVGMLGKLIPAMATAPTFVTATLGVGLAIFIVLGACNSTNLIDGLDGLCAGVKAIICLGFFALGWRIGLFEGPRGSEMLVASIAMAGAALGFLIWNYNPAKIFMGDAGSLLLGFNSGILMVQFAESGRWPILIAALLMFTVPVFDTALAMFRRWNSGKPIFVGDRSHFYDQLVKRGFTVRQTGAICYGLTAVIAAFALKVVNLETGPAFAVFCLTWVALAALAYGLGFTRPPEKVMKV